jgi:RNA polymerase sigma-70 factor (ECF subfamily)
MMPEPVASPSLEVLLAHEDFVRGLARALVLDASSAEDVAQETWLAAVEHPPRTADAPRSWLARVARNLANQLRRRETRRARREAGAAKAERLPSADEIVAREEMRRRVLERVLALEEPYRSTVLLRYFEGLPPREIARRMGVPVATVRTRIGRALERLRERLDREYGDRRSWIVALAPLGRWRGRGSLGSSPAEEVGEAPRRLPGRTAAQVGGPILVAGAVALVAMLDAPRGPVREAAIGGKEGLALAAPMGSAPAVPEGPVAPKRLAVGSEELPARPVAPKAFREVVLHLAGGGKARGFLVDYLPPGTYVIEGAWGRSEVAGDAVEDVEFLDVTEKLRREERDRLALGTSEAGSEARLRFLVSTLASASGVEAERAAQEIRRFGGRAVEALEAFAGQAGSNAAARARSLAEEIRSRMGKVALEDGESYDFAARSEGGEKHIRFADGELSVGFAGSDFGHILDLGAVDPAAVGLQDGRWLAEGRAVRTYELFARHLDPAPMRRVYWIRPQPGHAYLLRSESEALDLVELVTVERLEEDRVEIAWEEILSYGGREVEERRGVEAADWAARSRGRLGGRALLWSRGPADDYVKATFSFEFATRDHAGVVRDDWDLQFEMWPDGTASVNMNLDDRSEIREVHLDDLEGAVVSALPTDGYEDRCRLRVGGTYAVHTLDSNSDLWSVFRVTGLDPGRWVELEWRRLERK